MLNTSTNIYHIAYTPELKEVCLFFWGCNIDCRGCYCKRRIYSPMLKDWIGAHLEDPDGVVPPPNRFLNVNELVNILDGYDFTSVILEGQEASIDPALPLVAEILHERYDSCNTLLTNAYELTDLSHVDQVEIGLKAITDSLHQHYTGASNARILRNIVNLHKSGTKMFIESVLIPGYIDVDEVERISKFIAGLDRNIRLVLLPYFKSSDNPWRRPSPAEMEEAADIAKKSLGNVFFFRGDEELKYEVSSAYPVGIGRVVTAEAQPERALAPVGV
jgi:pyruvate-formate lyase-activating enzyme